MSLEGENLVRAKKLKAQIGQFKGQITRAIKFVSEQQDHFLIDTEAVQIRIQNLQTSLPLYRENNLNLQLLLNTCSDENLEQDEIEELCFDTISNLQKILKSTSAQNNIKATEEANTELNKTEKNAVMSKKLPQLEIPTFDGKDVVQFKAFSDMFEAIIDKDTNLASVQKLFYLRKYLKGDALILIEGLPLVNESYDQALSLLKNRYDNKCILITHHLNLLLDLQPISKGTSTNLRQLVSKARQQLGALKGLGQKVECWDMVIVTILIRKLDTYSCRAYFTDRNQAVLPTLNELFEFLEKRALSFEESQQTEGERNPPLRKRIMFPPANLTIFHENVQKLIHDPKEEFDVVIAEWMFVDLVGCGLAAVFNCPLIWSTSMETLNVYLSLVQGSMNPAHTITKLPIEDPPFSFWMRLRELYQFWSHYIEKWLYHSEEEDLFKKAFGDAVVKRGRALPSYFHARYNASLVLANSYVSTGTAMSLPQNYKQIGGYHIDRYIKPLPKDLQKIMDDSKHGVIYFSLGSIIHTRDTPDKMKTSLMKMFGGLKQTVIWKFDSDFSDVPSNVHLMKWVPQQSVLAHNNCILFITHGGLLSLIEAIHSGVPIIGIPFFADQFINVKRAVAKGFGKQVTATMDLARDLKEAIEDVIGNHSYKEKAREYSAIHSHRLVPPGQELVFWVQHVVSTRGAPHLRSPANVVPFYQIMYLDLLLVAVVIFYGIYKGANLLLRHDLKRKLKSA